MAINFTASYLKTTLRDFLSPDKGAAVITSTGDLLCGDENALEALTICQTSKSSPVLLRKQVLSLHKRKSSGKRISDSRYAPDDPPVRKNVLRQLHCRFSLSAAVFNVSSYPSLLFHHSRISHLPLYQTSGKTGRIHEKSRDRLAAPCQCGLQHHRNPEFKRQLTNQMLVRSII